MIIAKKPEGNGDFQPIPAGTYQAVCYGVWNIGIQTRVWNGEEKKKHQVIISWEIDKLIETEGEYKGKRFVISQRYTLSLHEKATLRKHLESWRGKPFTDKELEQGFNIEKLKGVNCLLNIIHNVKGDKTYANVSAIMACAKGTQPMTPENDGTPPEWVQKLIKKEPENNEPPNTDQYREPSQEPPAGPTQPNDGDFFTEDGQQKDNSVPF